MHYLDLSFNDPASNLACDEALLETCEEHSTQGVLRFWESPQHFVVLGRSNSAQTEVNLNACQNKGIPILRRCSGGGTVLQGPGCLNYALILDSQLFPWLSSISLTNTTILKYHKNALEPILSQEIGIKGCSDLTLGHLKVSGNAQRRKRRFVLFHGTFLIHLDLNLMAQILATPSREPEYRASRSHLDFVTPIPLSPEQIKKALQRAWKAHTPITELPQAKIDELVQIRYSQDSWNHKL